jgi:hypothetical protein
MDFESQKMFRVLLVAVLLFFFSVKVHAQVNSTETSQPPADAPVVAANTTEPSSAAPNPPAPPARTPQGPEPSSPLQIKIGDATITPVAFMDLTNTFRSTNSGAISLATNFGNFPYSNNVPTGLITEDRFSAQNSRIGFRVDAKVKGANVLGYYEGDFVGGVGASGIAPSLNTQVTSNSVVYRMRLYWVSTRYRKFEFLAGQSWSMMTPNRKQISALPGDLFYGQVVDVNYIAGLTWGRIPGLRFLVHPSEKVTWGISFENASQYFGGSGGAGNPVLPTAFQIPAVFAQLDGSSGNGTTFPNGLSVPQVHPDIISRLAFDPNSHVHFEFTGVESTARLLNPTSPTQVTNKIAGGGGSFNGNFEVAKGFRLITNNFWSDGEGRYIFGQVPNFIVRANGTLSSIHSGSTIQGFEYTVKNSLLYAYYGGIYAKPNTALDANGTTRIGWGFQGAANSQNRSIQEATFGDTQTIWRDAKYGALQLLMQYAYFTRSPYSVAVGAPSNAHQHAAWFNVRYVLPGAAPTILPPQ